MSLRSVVPGAGLLLLRLAALVLGIYLVAATAVARWSLLPQHRAFLGIVSGFLLLFFVLTEKRR